VRTQLLCTFTTESSFEGLLTKIFDGYELFSRKIFILKLEPSKELVISYNIVPNNENKFLPNTIMVHRKKDYNAMYTINALNRLIKELNGGVEDKKYQINWNDYKNSMILTDGEGYKIMSTKLFRIVDVN
jgi:hypothetical protein|tara:strand:+ start:2531 stop:2920 length:390 start_codon:yes stop_codon:yes gene_type:complete